MSRRQAIEIRLLGRLEVHRADGAAVDVKSFRTGKTMDLLRLLALSNGRPLRPESAIAKLWPSVTTERGRGSLRTATSQIRAVLDRDCVVRQPDGLVLRDAWVDAVELQRCSQLAKHAFREGRHADVVALAREADALWRGDFHAHDDESAWAEGERTVLRQARLTMLCDAAESALELGDFREALEQASAAARLDSSSEGAHRTLMRALAELGEIAGALRVFESYRSHLAEELGADPSRQTLDLHVRLLRGSPGG